MSYPTRTTRKPAPGAAVQDERVGALLGERGQGDPGLKAVTRADAAGLGVIALQSAIVSATPSAAEHNALVADVHALAAVLNALGARFTGL